jgi:probable HAF family extracellular repeat protein
MISKKNGFPLLLIALICLPVVPAQAVIYEMHDMGNLFAYAINNHGQAAGAMDGGDGTIHAFTWKDGQTTDLGPGWGSGVNDLGQVAFYSGTQNDCEVAIWKDGVVTRIPGITPGFAEPFAINNSGQVMGSTFDGLYSQGWIWQNGNLTYLGAMGTAGSHAIALNDVGQVIGYTITATTM